MKKLLAATLCLLAFNAFATTTYGVKYATITSYMTNKSNKNTFITIPTPTISGDITLFETKENKLEILKQENIAQSPLAFTIFVNKAAGQVGIAENNTMKIIVAPAQIFTKPLTGSLISAQFPKFSFGEFPAVDNKVKEFVANALGHNNFKLSVTSEDNNGSCNEMPSKDVKCLMNIFRNYQVEVE